MKTGKPKAPMKVTPAKVKAFEKGKSDMKMDMKAMGKGKGKGKDKC